MTVSTPRALRGQLLGTVFGIAVLGAILGPMVGAVAKLVGLRAGFAGIGVIALLLAVAAFLQPRPGVEVVERGAVRRAFADPAFVAGLWLNALPALFFGVLDVLAPLALDAGGYGAIAIGAVFLVAGLIETALNPLLGRLSDRRGRLLPIRWALCASIVVGILLAVRRHPGCDRPARDRGALSFGGFYTPGIALVSDRAEIAALAQGLAFGVMNTAWAAGALVGPTVGGGLADLLGDAAPYLLCSFLCAVDARDDQRARAIAPDRQSDERPSAAAAARGTARAPRRRRADAGGSPRRRRARSPGCADPSAAATRPDRTGCGRRSGRSPRRTTTARRWPSTQPRMRRRRGRRRAARPGPLPSRCSCSAVCSAIVRSRTMYGSGPPSAERYPSADGRKLRSRSRNRRPLSPARPNVLGESFAVAPVTGRLRRDDALLEDLLALLTPHASSTAERGRGCAPAADAPDRDRAEHRADDGDDREGRPHRRVARSSSDLQAHERRERESHRGRASERTHVGPAEILGREPCDGRLGDRDPQHLADHEQHQDQDDHRQQRADAEGEERQPHQQHRHHPAPGRGNAATRRVRRSWKTVTRIGLTTSRKPQAQVGTPWLSTSEIGSTVS